MKAKKPVDKDPKFDRDFNVVLRCPVCRAQLRPIIDKKGPRYICACKGWDK